MPRAAWYLDPALDVVEPPRYACVLDEQPGWTCPRPFQAAMSSGVAVAEPAPGLDVRDTRDLGLGDAFAPGPVAVTGDGAALPFWLGEEGRAAVQALLGGRSRAAALPGRWRDLLVAAGLAVRPGESPPADPPPGPGVCTALRGLVHPFHLGALRLHTRRLLRTGAMLDGDGQSPLRWVQHNEPVAAWVHQHLARRVSGAVGKPVQPSYVYTATYHDQARLPMHVDREQCRYTVSLCVDCLPEPSGEVPWPLVLEPPGARVRVYQELGDGLLYGGTDIPHGRPSMPPGLVVTAMFFHFVGIGFTGPLR
jgi:hypothetical protein